MMHVDQSEQNPCSFRLLVAVAIVLAVATLIPYLQVVEFDFVSFDDGQYVYDNARVRQGITWDNFRYALTTGEMGTWQPVTILSHMLDCQLFGVNPAAHHAVNVVIHVLASVVLLLALQRLTGALWPSAFVAAVFALHPLHVESVAWISERKDVLSGLFWMLSLYAYAAYAEKPGWLRYASVLLLFALGLMAKPMLVTLPCVLLLLDIWPLNRLRVGKWQTWMRPTAEKMPLLLLSFAVAGVTFVTQQQGEAVSSLDALPLDVRLLNAIVSYVVYLGKTLWPANLAVYYPHPQDAIPLWQVMSAGLLLVVMSIAAIALLSRAPYIAVGWFWYLGALVPVIGIVQVGTQAYADRYTYLPMIGLTIAVAWTARDWLPEKSRWITAKWTVSALLIAAMGFLTWHQTSVWRDTLTLFDHAARIVPKNVLANYKVAMALEEEGAIAEAEEAYRRVLAIDPAHAEARVGLSGLLMARGEIPEMARVLEEGLKHDPDNSKLHNELGVALLNLGQYEQAVAHLAQAYALDPESVETTNNYATALLLVGEFKKAEVFFRDAIRQRPDDPDAWNNLGIAFAEQGRLQEAKACFYNALRANPEYAQAKRNLIRYGLDRKETPGG